MQAEPPDLIVMARVTHCAAAPPMSFASLASPHLNRLSRDLASPAPALLIELKLCCYGEMVACHSMVDTTICCPDWGATTSSSMNRQAFY